jgi:N-acetyl sugar amidotransferase
MKYCRDCVTPNSRPRITFDKQGVCNACVNAKNKKEKIDWNKRENEFFEIINKIKKENQNRSDYDCIVPWSGGKDSTYIALRLKFEFGLNPLLVTFSPLIPNEIGSFNREIILQKGFDNYFFRPDQRVSKLLARRFFIERGNPKVAWDAGINSLPVRMAIKFNIRNIFYAEHGESEYGGLVLGEESQKKRDEREVIEHLIGDYPENWISKDISPKDLNSYKFPAEDEIKKSRINVFYFSYFFKWSMIDNYRYVKKKISDFKTNVNGRTEGTFTNFDSLDDKIDDIYYYMQYIKFGFGRAIRDASRYIQNDEMTRNEAVRLVKKYDGEFPKKNIDEVLDFLNINEINFEEIINKHRNQEIWKKKDNYWELKNKLI